MKNFVLGFILMGSANLSLAATTGLTPEVLKAYQAVHQTLSHDEFPAARKNAEALHTACASSLTQGLSTVEKDLMQKLDKAASGMTATEEPVLLRKSFELVAESLVTLLRDQKALQPQWQLFYCPMAPGYRFWVQPKGERIANPYYGHEMLECGSKRPW